MGNRSAENGIEMTSLVVDEGLEDDPFVLGEHVLRPGDAGIEGRSRIIVVHMIDALESDENGNHIAQLRQETLQPLLDPLVDVGEEPLSGDGRIDGVIVDRDHPIRLGDERIHQVADTPATGDGAQLGPESERFGHLRLTATSPRCSSVASEERDSTTSPASRSM